MRSSNKLCAILIRKDSQASGFFSPEHLGIDTVVIIRGRGDYEFAHQIWLLNSNLQGNGASHAIAEEIGFFDTQLPEKCYSVLVFAKNGRKFPNEVSVADKAPWSKTSGLPVPWIS